MSSLAGASPTTTTTAEASSSSPTVVLDYATYAGRRSDGGVDAYLGMRYATPPLGDLRFRAPQDPQEQSGVQNASAFGPICIGAGQSLSSAVSEDCLYVNVFTPANATRNSNLPVWLYIQGGGYQTNSNANYNGTGVITASGQNIVFVNFNYRVGMLGFLASSEVRDDGNLNVGLLDQRKVFKWVQRYIREFGGDPNHVVIHGVSAGAGSVAYHLTAYGGRDDGLFHGAIAQSSFWPTSPLLSEVEYQYQRAVNNSGCNESTNALSCLRSLNITEIVSLDTEQTFVGANGTAKWYWLPVQDGDLIRSTQWSMLSSGAFVKVPLFVSNDNNEGSSFAPNASTSDQVETFFQNNYPKIEAAQLQQIITAYPLMAPLPQHAAWFPSAAAAYGDSTFICPGEALSAYMAQYHSPKQVWSYRCYITSASNVAAGLGTSHTFETAAILGTQYGGSVASTWTTDNAAIIPVVMHYYISFVRALNPNTFAYDGPGTVVWEPWGDSSGISRNSGYGARRLRLQTNDTHMEAVPRNMTQNCAMWEDFSKTMET
ncbi:Alpha/Beta hydrolase protein [Xylariales sp. PMI_506]|nr:Alpha/Beta hydrolase protein [Xylariales sp. PMI_506]